MGKYRTIDIDLNRNYRNDINKNFEDVDVDIKAIAAETKRVETELKSQLDEFVGGGLIEGTEAARDKANAAAINADTKAALANTKAVFANEKGDYAKTQGDHAKLQGDYAKDKAIEADTAANKAIAESSNLDGLKIAVTDATQAAGVAAEKANTSASAADVATGKANTAATKADTAIGKADAAADNANAKALLAKQSADKAEAEATGLETLKKNVTTATTVANDAAQTATTAAGSADSATLKANTAADKANAKALDAETQANYAKTQGDFAKEQGDYSKLQGDHAKSEGDKAALESAGLSGLKTAVSSATDDALIAAELANTEASGLSDMKDAVTTATSSAEGATAQATFQADHAKTQGDYAKTQGDRAKEIVDTAPVVSVNGKKGVVVLNAEDVGAETPDGVDAKVQGAKNYTDDQIALIPEVDLRGYETVEGAQTKANIAETKAKEHANTEFAKKVDKISGKGLSSNDFTTAEKNKLNGIQEGAEKNIPVPTATKIQAEMGTDNANFMTPLRTKEAIMKLSPPTDISGKVDKVIGKQLSTEDYTTAEKQKLSGVAIGAQVNTVTSVAGRTGSIVISKTDVGLGAVENVKQMPINGGTFLGLSHAQANTSYTVAQLRNVILSDGDPVGGNNGDIWIKYK